MASANIPNVYRKGKKGFFSYFIDWRWRGMKKICDSSGMSQRI
jgi:hypothetical protein